MTIRGRVVKMFGLMGTLMLVQMALVVYLQREGERLRDAANRTRTVVEHLDEAQQDLLAMQAAERGYAATGSRYLLENYSGARRRYLANRDAARDLLDDEGRLQLAHADAIVEDWMAQGASASIAARARSRDVSIAILTESDPRWQPIVPAIKDVESREFARLRQAEEAADGQTQRATALMLLIPLICVVTLVYLSIDATVRTLRPMAALGRSAQAIARGNFIVPPPEGFGGEVAVVRDAFELMATAIQRRERDLHAIIETIPTAVMTFDARGRVARRNKAVDAVYAQVGVAGSTPETAREAERQVRLANKDGSDAPVGQWPVSRALRGETVLGMEMRVCGPGGRSLPILSSAAPLRDEEGGIAGAVLAFQDITQLLEVDRMKTDFISVVSHELRTPLTSIRGALQLALSDDEAVSDPAIRQLLTVALNNSERLTRIVNDILDMAKLEASGLPLDIRACRVEELLRVALQSVERIASASGVHVVTQLAPDLRSVPVDFDRAVQVLVNLLSNAIKFAPSGSEVRIEGMNRDGMVAIAIQDHGAGIAKEDLARLFRKFQQVDSSASRRVGGTGLGLAITRALVEQHGGRVEVESELGRGSTFTVILPAATASDLVASRESSDLPHPMLPLEDDQRQARVLLAEDDEGLCIVLRQALLRGGYEVLTARNGREAWVQTTEQRPDLLLLDLAMPEMDGFEVIRRVRATSISHDVPIIAISGSDRQGPSERRARDLGANSFLAKPVDPSRLMQEIQRVLAASRLPASTS